MKHFLSLVVLALATPVAVAQDFYDIDLVRDVAIDFQDANWETLLAQNFQSQTNILADMTVEGVTYPDVGVRIRGNTSFFALPPGSQKFSLNITVDEVDPDQEIMGISSMNFNNAFTDPSFCREVMLHNVLARWIPSGRANHVNVSLNGQNWGLYANIQQYGKDVLREWFEDEDGLRVKCPNNPNGPGLQYQGTNPNSYSEYEIKNDGGLADPVGAIIDVCNAVDNTPGSQWQLIDQTVAIDPSIWTTLLENLYSDDDSYVNKGCDFVFYRNPTDGRTHLHQTDGNESWRQPNWSATFHFLFANKPFLSNVVNEPVLRGRWFAHMRTLMADFDWAVIGPEFIAMRDRIDPFVQADPKKLYTYQNFLDNFSQTVPVPGFPPFGGNIIGLEEYVTNRRATLMNSPALVAAAPVVANVAASTDMPGMPVSITADVSGIPIASVTCYYQPDVTMQYQLVTMLDDGLNGDGAAGDGVYGVTMPQMGNPGQRWNYYVGATGTGTFSPQTFEPKRTEMEPALLVFSAVGTSDVVINEFLAQNNSIIADELGSFEDYIELYNRSGATVDISGMFLNDTLSNPAGWPIPAGTMLNAGETILIWADNDATDGPLHADFKLGASGEEIGLWASDGLTLLDSVVFGQQQADVSTGLLFDGGTQMVTFSAPTPDALNSDGCGIRAYDQLDPSLHTLDLAASGSAALGTVVTLTGSGFAAGGSCLLAVDFAPAYSPFSASVVALMGGSIELYFATDVAGNITLPVGVPSNPGLAGLQVYFQMAGNNALSTFSASNALEVTLCP